MHALSWKEFDRQLLILTGEFLKQILIYNCQKNCVREAAGSKLPLATFTLTKVCFSSLSTEIPAAFLLPEGCFIFFQT